MIYSNATLQWLDGHRDLFPRLMGYVNPGGCLAVQMPLSWDMPSHRLMRHTLEHGGLNGESVGDDTVLAAVRRKWVEDAEMYYDLLSPLGQRLDIWETEYLQVLAGRGPGAGVGQRHWLAPHLNGLGEADRQVFLDAYQQALRDGVSATDGRPNPVSLPPPVYRRTGVRRVSAKQTVNTLRAHQHPHSALIHHGAVIIFPIGMLVVAAGAKHLAEQNPHFSPSVLE